MLHKVIIFGFISSVSIMIIIGIFALNTNQQTILSFETGEKHFKAIATAATEVSSYAKRAEGHLLMYLILHRNVDKEKFPQRVVSLNEQISILDEKIHNPEARSILEKIKSQTTDILSVGNALIEFHDNALENKVMFEIEKHQESIFKLHENFAAIRQLGVNLTELEIKLEAEHKMKIFENAGRLRFYVLFLVILSLGLAIFLGYILNKMINSLNQEISKRIQTEKTILIESNKLKDALARVNVLSGLIPICAACKKIRDDKGYWNQIENYIRDHSEAEFSHSICPKCEKKLYPDLCD